MSDKTERVETMRSVLAFLASYEKDPPEVLKDDFAYDRLLAFVHDVAAAGLYVPESDAVPYDWRRRVMEQRA